jgi:chaperonin GroES
MTSRIVPKNNRIVVRREEGASTSKGGIVIPSNSVTKSEIAIVVECAYRVDGMPESGKLYEIVLQRYAGMEVTINEVQYLVVAATEVLAVLEEEEEEEEEEE